MRLRVLGRQRATTTIAGAHLLLDAVALTALLALSGGVTNSFTTMYFVPMTLATQLSPRWTWAVAATSLLGFAALFVLAPPPSGPPGHEQHFIGHIRGMWVAFGMSAAFMTYFVHRIALSLARQRAELARLRLAAAQDRQLAALGTLAAGAAHELGSPLGTVSMLVSDLAVMSEAERGEAIATIKQELQRCKHILGQMSSPELRVRSLAAASEPWPLARLAEELSPGRPASCAWHRAGRERSRPARRRPSRRRCSARSSARSSPTRSTPAASRPGSTGVHLRLSRRGRAGADHGRRRRHRHGPAGGRGRVRPVLLDQAEGAGHGPRPVSGAGPPAGARRPSSSSRGPVTAPPCRSASR
jgi:hypothetical protein